MEELKERILQALRGVQDPELHQDLVSLGMVGSLELQGQHLRLQINLTTPACPLRERIDQEIREALRPLGLEVELSFGQTVRSPQQLPLPGVKHIVAIASGKGGVGKSTVAANLAVALALEGTQVGLLDADVYGPSQAQMFGTQSERLRVSSEKKILPLDVHGIRLLSIANMVPPGQAMVWRGPILHSTLRQFLQDVAWGDLDYLIVDLPPGTGDVQLSLSQLAKVTGGVIVTTPQEVARIDAERALDMFRKVQIPILGVIENMSYYLEGERKVFLFGEGGGKRLAEAQGVPLLGEIPLSMAIREGGDEGRPLVLAHPEAPEAEAFRNIARHLAGALSVHSLLLPMA
jgi:ATP-binding protein involved in chromosome partitioning